MVELHEPKPGPGEIRLAVRACGLNFADLLMAKGTYQDTPALPFTLGMEVAGVVEAQGDGVTGPPMGSRVAVFAGQGGLAEQAVVPADRCVVLPDDMPDSVAAGFQVAYGTSHLALLHRARLGAAETLLVTGAAGGVGLTAVEIGKAAGARVIAVARGAAKREIALSAGADLALEAEDPDLLSRLKAEGGVDVAYETVGGDLFRTALRALRPEGRILPIGFASGDIPKVPANIVLVKNITVIGMYWGGYLAFDPARVATSMAELIDWYSDGRLSPHIGLTLPLDRAAEALDALAARKSTGKVVVTMP